MKRDICITVDWDPPPPSVDGTKHPGWQRGPDGKLLRTEDGGYVERTFP